MLKRGISLYIDVEVIRFCKARGINISKEVERYLQGLMGIHIDALKPDDRHELIERLEHDLAKARVEQAEFEVIKQADLEKKKKAGLLDQVNVLRELQLKKDTDKFANTRFTKLFNHCCKAFGLTRAELLDFVEGKRVLK